MTIHRACKNAILAVVPFVCARRVVRDNITGNADSRDASSTRANPYSLIAPDSSLRGTTSLHGCLLSMSGHRNYSPGSGGPFIPQLLSGSLAEVPSDTGQDNPGRNSNMHPCFIRIGSSKIAVRFSAVTTQVQSPLSKFVLRVVGFLVATHVFNHMSGVSQRAGKDNQDRGYFSQAKNGRNSNVRR